MITDSERECIIVGLKQVKRALAEKKAKKVFLARDCDEYLLKGLEDMCAGAGIEPVYADTMKELGSQCGIQVKASCACVC